MTLSTQWIGSLPVVQTVAGPEGHILLLPPLFEEANRMRHMLCNVMRGVAEQGFGASLPDLPGMGEHPPIPGGATLSGITDAIGQLAANLKQQSQTLVIAAFRSGSLLDHHAKADGYWRFSPETGARILRTMERTESGPNVAEESYSPSFLAGLRTIESTSISPLRTIRLTTDRGEADARVDGPPLWRWAEPGAAPELVRQCVDDLCDWTRQCAAS